MLPYRKIVTRLLASCFTAVLGAALFISPAHAAKDNEKEVIKWRLQAHLPTGSGSWEDSIVAMRDKLKERTNGRLQIELHPADSLMGAKEIFPAVRRGVIEMGYTSPAYLMDYIPTAGLAFAVPGAFKHVWEATYFWTHLGFEDLIREEAAEHDVLYFTDKLYPTEMLLKEPVNSLKDFKALKIRSAGLLQRLLSDAGAATSYIPGPEIYQSLATGVVDGAHWGAAQEANALSLYEVAKYHVRPALGIGGVEAFIINEEAMSSLPADIQETVRDTLKEHFWARTNEYQFQEVETLEGLAGNEGVSVIQLPQEVQERIWEAGEALRAEEAKKSENAAEAVRRLNRYLRALGRID